MEEIGKNLVKGVDFSYLAKKTEPDKAKEVPAQKTGDLGAYLDNVGNSQKLFVNKESPIKKEKALKEELRFLRHNYSKGLKKDDPILDDFHFLVGKMPAPKSPDELGEKSYDDYLRRKALDVLDKFEQYMQNESESSDDINAARESAFKKMMSG